MLLFLYKLCVMIQELCSPSWLSSFIVTNKTVVLPALKPKHIYLYITAYNNFPNIVRVLYTTYRATMHTQLYLFCTLEVIQYSPITYKPSECLIFLQCSAVGGKLRTRTPYLFWYALFSKQASNLLN